MVKFLANKRILLGVTGSIAAYKSADLVRRLREAGATVRVAMTENAKRFITPLTMQAVSGHPIHEDLFDLHAEAAMGHIELARWADLILIAPATADFASRLASGRANDLLTAVCLASKASIALAPAMNQAMWKHHLTQQNMQILQEKGVAILGPGEGSQACGDTGFGRMLEPEELLKKVSELLVGAELAGLKIVITAGPTHEAIDPIRFLSNASSGKMGYALAEAAYAAGGEVCLISGPSHLAKPPFIEMISVVSAKEMYEAVMRKMSDCDIFLAVAAVSDYRCQTIAEQKLHKTTETLSLTLELNPDIVWSVGQLADKPFTVGFAAETENVVENAKLKRQRKNMDMIVANQVGRGLGMGCDENAVTVIKADEILTLPKLSKTELARQLIHLIAKSYQRTA